MMLLELRSAGSHLVAWEAPE